MLGGDYCGKIYLTSGLVQLSPPPIPRTLSILQNWNPLNNSPLPLPQRTTILLSVSVNATPPEPQVSGVIRACPSGSGLLQPA